MTRVIGLGAGGHAKVLVETVRLLTGYEIAGLLDANDELWGKEVLGVPVLGNDTLLSEMYAAGIRHAFIGLGALADVGLRKLLYDELCAQGFQVIDVVHPRAVLSPSVESGQGLTVMAGVVINASVRLGANVLVNTGAIIEHDCVIGDHVHVATGARLAGTVSVADGAHVGIGASVRQGTRIGEGAIVGAGAVVVEDVPQKVVVAGVPARILKRVGD